MARGHNINPTDAEVQARKVIHDEGTGPNLDREMRAGCLTTGLFLLFISVKSNIEYYFD